MKSDKEHANGALLDIVVVVVAWQTAIALIYTVVIKLRVIIKH